jgi:predicted small lipoprotein YifL
MSDRSVILGAVLIACALTACGQKGPLYLPEAPTEVVTRPAATPAPAPAPEETPAADKKKTAAPPPK